MLGLVALVVAVWLILRGMSHAATQPAQSIAPAQLAAPPLDLQGPVSGSDDISIDSIVQGVIHAESGGRQTDSNGNTLRSKAGALGLMQLMPSTAAQLGVDPNDAAQNVAGGTAYLQQLFVKFGNWFDALAAYNWGPANVARAQANGTQYPSAVNAYASGILESAS